MPYYDFRCAQCDLVFERMVSFADFDLKQACPDCESDQTNRLISKPHVIFKGDDWASKNIRVKGQMARKNARLDQKMKDHVAPPLPPMTPNVDGEVTKSWSEAKQLAGSKGKETSTYDPMIQQENKRNKA